MTQSQIHPLIVGRGAAGRALHHAMLLYPEEISAPKWLERGALIPPPRRPETALLAVADPHALHTPRLLEAAKRGFRFAICEKPAAVDLEQVESLRDLPLATWICHGYRLLWGPQELRRAVANGRLGAVFSIEGRYWHSSATRVLDQKSWKDEVELAGRYDALLDLATHWADLATFVCGRTPDTARVRRWYVNAASPHRDTHVHVTMQHGDLTSFGSVSKTAHGVGNHLELKILGERASASWSFQQPDVIVWGRGNEHSTQVRSTSDLPARPAPFHGLGWMEGYGRLVEEVVTHMRGGECPTQAATLEEHLAIINCLLLAAEREGDAR
jgi:predicted dehydrogenase